MSLWATAPILLHGLFMGLDEFVYHRKRGLPLWERRGHPVDTVLFLLPIAVTLFLGLHFETLFFVLAGVSCLIIVKDEWVHQKHCSGSEMALHALLFVFHPIVLYVFYWDWQNGGTLRPFLMVQFGLALCFLVYQIIYWNFVRE